MKFDFRGSLQKKQKPELDHGGLRLQLEELLGYVELRRTATRLRQICIEQGIRSVAVVSFGCGEGKSTLVAGLAMFMARCFGLRILIVETATFHRPGSVRLDALLGFDQTNLSQPTVSPVFPGVHLMRMKDRERKGYYSRDVHDVEVALSEVEGKFDLVLIDTVALELRNRQNYDAQAIASCADGAILVKSTTDIAPEIEAQIHEDLRAMKLNLLGVIANSGGVA